MHRTDDEVVPLRGTATLVALRRLLASLVATFATAVVLLLVLLAFLAAPGEAG